MSQTISANPKGTSLSRYARALLLGRGDVEATLAIADQWKDSPSVKLTVQRAQAAAVSPIGTPDGLAEFGISAEFFELYRSASVVARMAGQMRATPFRTRVPRELDSGVVASWIPESTLKPVRAFSFDDVELNAYKMGALVVLTQELARMSRPSAEVVIRTILVNAVASFVDGEFLSSNAPITGESPGGIAYLQPSVLKSGDSEAAVGTDLAAMAGLLTSWTAPVWVTRPKTLCHLAGRHLVNFLPGGPMLLGFPVFTTVASPAQILLLDLGAILLADDGQTSIGLSRHANIIMGDGKSPEVETEISLWQSNLGCLRVERQIAWLAAHDGAAVVMDVAY